MTYQAHEQVTRIMYSLDFIEQNTTMGLDLEQAAYRSGLSRYAWQRLFQKVTGYSPGEYLRRRVLSRCLDHVVYGKESFTQLAFQYGYSSLSAFSRAFAFQYGKTAHESRNQQKKPWYGFLQPYQETQLMHRFGGGITLTPEPTIMKADRYLGIWYCGANKSPDRDRAFSQLRKFLAKHLPRAPWFQSFHFQDESQIIQQRSKVFIGFPESWLTTNKNKWDHLDFKGSHLWIYSVDNRVFVDWNVHEIWDKAIEKEREKVDNDLVIYRYLLQNIRLNEQIGIVFKQSA